MGIEIRCKWGRPDEYIKNKFIPLLLVFHIGINYLRAIFLFLLSLAFPSFSTVGPLEHLAPSTQRGLSCVEHTRLSIWYSPAVESSPFWGPLVLAQILPEEKQPSPERVARNPRKGPAGSHLSGWPQAPSGVPAVLLPFFREDIHQFPLRVQAVPPTGEKPPDPWGPSWPRLGPSRGESGPQQNRDRTGGYRCRHHNSCGTREMGNDVMISSHPPSTLWACAK